MREANDARRGGDRARRRAHRAGHARERRRRDVGGLRPRRGRRTRARLHAGLVGPRHPDLHGDRRPSRPGERADAARDLGLRRRLLVRPHEERVPGRPHRRVRRAARPAARGLQRRRRPLPGRREPAGARPARPRGHRRGRLSGPALPSDLPRRRRARPRAALRAPGRIGHDPRRHGAGDRAGDLLGGGRRAATRGQLPDHRRRAGEALRATRTTSDERRSFDAKPREWP